MRTFVRHRWIRTAGALVAIGLTCAPALAVDYTWNNPAGGNWSTPTNWTPNGVPNSPTDRVTISLSGTYTITLSSTVSVERFLAFGSTLSHPTLQIQAGAELSFLSGTSTINQNGTLFLNGNTSGSSARINGLTSQTLVNNGTLIGRGRSHIQNGVLVTNGSTGLIRAEGIASITNFIIDNMITSNSGDIQLTQDAGVTGTTFTVTNNMLTNSSFGVIESLASSPASPILRARLDNRGSILVNQSLQLRHQGGQYLNNTSGTITIAPGKMVSSEDSIAITQSGQISIGSGGLLEMTSDSFTQNGQISIGSGGLLEMNGGTFNYNVSGSITGAGRAVFVDSSLSLAVPYQGNVGTDLVRCFVDGPGAFVNAGSMDLNRCTLDTSVDNASGTIRMKGDSSGPVTSITSLTNSAGATLSLEPNVAQGLILQLDGDSVNSGTLSLSSSVSANVEISMFTHVLSNASTGHITIVDDNLGGTRNIRGRIINLGTIHVPRDATFGYAGEPLGFRNDAGASLLINNGATLTLQGNGFHENRGTLQILEGSSLIAQANGDIAFVNRGFLVMTDAQMTLNGGQFRNESGFFYVGGDCLLDFTNAQHGLENRTVVAVLGSDSTLQVNGTFNQIRNPPWASFESLTNVFLHEVSGQTVCSSIQVTGTAALAGNLVVDKLNSPPFVEGQTFDALQAASITGTFDVAFLPGLPDGLYLSVNYVNAAASVDTVQLQVQSLSNLVGLGMPQSQSLPGPPTAGVLADLDQDGDDDLAICIDAALPGNPGSVLVLFNAGSVGGVWQGFSDSTQITVGVDPVAIDVGLLDADAAFDLAVVNQGNNNLWILRNNGDGSFSQLGPAISTNSNPSSVVIGDLDSPPGPGGSADLVVAATGPIVGLPGTAQVFSNNGSGAFGPIIVIPVGIQPVRVTVGDVDGDRDLDAMSANQGSNTVTVLFNPGDGQLGSPTDYVTGIEPTDLQCTDLNNDGLMDIVVANQASADPAGTVSILLNDAGDPGALLAASNVEVGERPRSLVVADLDVDGDDDVVVLQDLAGQPTVQVLRNDSSAVPGAPLVMATAEALPVGAGSVVVLAGDLDGVNGADVLAVNDGTAPMAGGGSGGRAAGPSNADVAVLLNNSAPHCPGDVNHNDTVNIDDLVIVITSWNQTGSPGSIPADITLNGVVNIDDLVAVITAWGNCR